MKKRILFKYPTRGRPARFFEGMSSLVCNLADRDNYHILVTADTDDLTMNNDEVRNRLSQFPETTIIYGASQSKVHAVNRDMENWQGWDIVVVMSDDMRFMMFGFDELIRQEMPDDLDCLLHIPDQDAKEALATMYIGGHAFYQRMGWIYHPEFNSLWCDNHIQDIATLLGKYKFVPAYGVIAHLCPAYGHLPRDEMFDRQQADWNRDKALYDELRARGYDLHLYQ